MKNVRIFIMWTAMIVIVPVSLHPIEMPAQQAPPSQNPHFLKAEEYLEAKEYDNAVEEYQKSIEIEPANAWAYSGIVRTWVYRGEPESAREYMDSLIEKDPRNACAWFGLGYYCFAQETYDEALKVLKKAVEINPQLANAHNTIGAIYYLTGELNRGMDSFELSLSLFQGTNDKKGEASCITNIGAIHGAFGNLQKALEYYLKALELDREIGFWKGEMIAMNNIARFYRLSGDLAKALEYYNRGLELNESTGYQIGVAANLNYIGATYHDLGDLSRALEFQKRALELHRELGIKLSQAIDLGDMAMVYQGLGDLPEALQCLRESLKLNREMQVKPEEAENLMNMGQIYQQLGELSASLEYCSQALQLYREMRNRVGEAKALNEIGLVHLKSHEYSEALKCFEESLRLASEMHIPETIWRCQKSMGDVFVQTKQLDSALQSYCSSIETIEGMRRKLELEEFKASFTQDKMEVYEKTVDLLIQMDRADEAFRYVERAKARALLEMLVESRIDIYQGVDEKLLGREREILREISRIQTDLQNPNLTREDRENLTGSLQKEEEKLGYLRLELRRENPRYADLRYPEPYNVGKVQREILSDGDAVILEYLLGETQSYVWIVSKERLEVALLPPREQIEIKVKRTLSILSQPPTQRILPDRSLPELYDMLLPFDRTDLSGVKSLVVVPDGILFHLPFEALIQSEAEDPAPKARFLIENFDVSYAPSSSTLALIQGRSKEERDVDLLIFGDPYYGEEETKEVLARGSTAKTLYGRYSFPTLKFSGEETRTIASLYPDDRVKMFLRKEATEEELKKEELQGYRMLHFATHGILDEIVPGRSGIVLAQDTDPIEDGFVQVHEIFNLRLNADMVVLSACQTGLGKLVRGEGMLGLSRAFFFAGTSSVVASLWSVNDRSTAMLMTQFYQNLKDGMDKRSALRKAKLVLLSKGGRQAHPYYWAPFVLMGDHE